MAAPSRQGSGFAAGAEALGLMLVAGATVYVTAALSPWPQPARALGRSWRRFGRAADAARPVLVRAGDGT
jgi:hypothetical protein